MISGKNALTCYSAGLKDAPERTCEGCPCMCIEELVGCNNYVKRKAADMLEKLAAEKDAKKPEWISVENRLPDKKHEAYLCNLL